MHVELQTSRGVFDVCPARDAAGRPDADDAAYTEQFLDQTLSAASKIAQPNLMRPQPDVRWRQELPTVDATHPAR